MRIAIALALLVACGQGRQEDPGPAAPATATAKSPPVGERPAAPPAVAAAPPAAKAAPIAPEKRAAYAARLRAGRAHARAKRWGQAVTAFEAALVAVPEDDRALVELGFAALQAGDLDKAEKANAESVMRAADPQLKAAGLYNLGRVAEGRGNRDRAAAFYLASLALRPNATVGKRLVALGKPAPATSTDPAINDADVPCADPVPEPDQTCECLRRLEPYEEGFAVECSLSDAGEVDDARIARVGLGMSSEAHFVLFRGAKGWQVIGALGEFYGGGVAGVSNEREELKVEERVVGGVRVLWYEWRMSGHDTDLGIDEDESYQTDTVVLCVLGGGEVKTPSCPLAIPVVQRYERDRLGLVDDAALADVKDLRTKGLPIHREFHLKIELEEDGTAVVVLDKGASGPVVKRLLGPHRLF